jgi:hypothetical protein
MHCGAQNRSLNVVAAATTLQWCLAALASTWIEMASSSQKNSTIALFYLSGRMSARGRFETLAGCPPVHTQIAISDLNVTVLGKPPAQLPLEAAL